MKKLDDIVLALTFIGIFAIGIATYAVLNVTTRPEMITVALELPARKSEVIMWDIIGDEFPPPPAWYTDYESEVVYYDEMVSSPINVLIQKKNIFAWQKTFILRLEMNQFKVKF